MGMSICLGLCGCGDDPDELFMKCKVAETSGEVTQEQLIDMYKAAVDAGSSDAAVYMAYHELTNNNIAGARTYAEKFKKDHPVDYNVINGVYLIGDNLNKENAERGAELLSKAAKTNNVRTYYPLGEYYFKNKPSLTMSWPLRIRIFVPVCLWPRFTWKILFLLQTGRMCSA